MQSKKSIVMNDTLYLLISNRTPSNFFLKKEVKKASLQNLAPWYYYYLFTVKWIKEGQDLAMVSPSTELCASHVGVL